MNNTHCVLNKKMIMALVKLSKREGEILLMIVQGDSNAMIAEQLFLSLRTVETHRYSICQKLGLTGKRALEEWVGKVGLNKIDW
ncbi:response regulator transcription factor [Fodinibius halophilus]|uniref:Helix-turn-helix transcriptional regulator n=1 Tax=Fodinibius halophilus TaxID=1736908 RepID=A0A6M1SX79_9BACT|nr:helix-turn-helix transcriptional regulator [Fodinibius halophilus]NGP88106.1 helix-turn-helix transcriptional regulator [Fodinibius halophilus]